MKGVVIHCAYNNCRKLLAKNVILPVGSSLEIKCAHCNQLNCVCADRDKIRVETNNLTDTKKSGIIFIEIE